MDFWLVVIMNGMSTGIQYDTMVETCPYLGESILSEQNLANHRKITKVMEYLVGLQWELSATI